MTELGGHLSRPAATLSSIPNGGEGRGEEALGSTGGMAKPGEGQLKRKIEITRFKGLGEISPKEFAQFIGKEMRLSKVEYAPKPEHVPLLNFYMGKNTPERKDYIMDKLVVPVEE